MKLLSSLSKLIVSGLMMLMVYVSGHHFCRRGKLRWGWRCRQCRPSGRIICDFSSSGYATVVDLESGETSRAVLKDDKIMYVKEPKGRYPPGIRL